MDRSRVLVVEDDPDASKLFEVILEDAGFEVTCASGGREALDALDRERPAAIVTDISMPGGTGLALLGSVRAREATKTIPVVVVSGTTDASWVVEQAGWTRYLTKPFARDDLVHALNELLSETPPPRE
jgi:DNA-binding response OmpR family regulator